MLRNTIDMSPSELVLSKLRPIRYDTGVFVILVDLNGSVLIQQSHTHFHKKCIKVNTIIISVELLL